MAETIKAWGKRGSRLNRWRLQLSSTNSWTTKGNYNMWSDNSRNWISRSNCRRNSDSNGLRKTKFTLWQFSNNFKRQSKRKGWKRNKKRGSKSPTTKNSKPRWKFSRSTGMTSWECPIWKRRWTARTCKITCKGSEKSLLKFQEHMLTFCHKTSFKRIGRVQMW